MESFRVERLDHFGLIASVIKDLRLIERIDACLMPDEQEALTPGQALAGMILNGLGFTTRPLSLTPQFFANKPLDLLFHDGVHAGMFNRFKLQRSDKRLMQKRDESGYDRRQIHPRHGGDDHAISLACRHDLYTARLNRRGSLVPGLRVPAHPM